MEFIETMKELKKYICDTNTRDVEKELADAYEEEISEDKKIGAFCFDINDQLECYLYVQSKNDVVSCLLLFLNLHIQNHMLNNILDLNL